MLAELKQIVQRVNQIPVLDEALGHLVSSVKETIKADCCTVYLADYDLNAFKLMATEGLAKSAIGQVSIGFSEGLIGLVGQREEPINIANANLHPRFKHAPEVKEEEFNAFLGTPIIHHRRVLGVLTVQQKAARFFNQDEEAFLVTLAAQLASVIAHAEARGVLANPQDVSGLGRGILAGIPGSPGVAVGKGFLSHPKANFDTISPLKTLFVEREIERYRKAVKTVQVELKALTDDVKHNLPEDAMGIFDSYHYLLDAASLGIEVEAHIKNGWTAATGLKFVVENYMSKFQAMEDDYIKERAADVKDMGERVLFHILKLQNQKRVIPENTILVAEEVTASMLAEIPQEKLLGIISMKGSRNSHAAIVARAMGIPAIMGLEEINSSQFADKDIVVDGYSGEVYVDPKPSLREEYLRLVAEEEEMQLLVQEQKELEPVTSDGKRISLLVNAGLAADTESGADVSADGVGLYRTEIPFMVRDRFPSEKEQCALYHKVLKAYKGRVVTMRTLDVGGDKALPYFPIIEDNPFLGWRGIRMTLDHPEIFLVQIRAMLRANVGMGNLQIMLPMVTSATEVFEAIRLIRQAYYEVSDEIEAQYKPLGMPKIGVMLEVPALIYQLADIAPHVDFFSVGSNDLTQYLLAVDRNNSRVANLYDSYHPAVLKALQEIVEKCGQLKVPVSICGELAGEPAGALLLIAMGYNRLSMNTHNLLKIKWVIRNVSMNQVNQLLVEALEEHDPDKVRQKVSYFLEILGLGGLVRAGK